MVYKLGCQLKPYEPILRFGDYFHPRAVLPTPPVEFGHEGLVDNWGMLANDTIGDCAIAGPYHAQMLWCAEGKRPFPVSDPDVIGTYSAVTGYVPGDESTDRGSDPQEVADYWQYSGLRDHSGNVHRIGGWVDLTPGNLTELWLATWLLDGVGVCLNLPSAWMQQFSDDPGTPWDALDPDADIEGGHYVLGVCRRGGNLGVVTWGRVQPMTPAGYKQFNVRTLAYVSSDKLVNGCSLEGFNMSQLQADLLALPKAA
jgi:hypothetical protein